MENLKVEQIPSLIYYPANNKQPHFYGAQLKSDFTEEALVRWMKDVSSKKVDWSEYLKLEADAE